MTEKPTPRRRKPAKRAPAADAPAAAAPAVPAPKSAPRGAAPAADSKFDQYDRAYIDADSNYDADIKAAHGDVIDGGIGLAADAHIGKERIRQDPRPAGAWPKGRKPGV